MSIRLEFKPQDCWIGVFWRTSKVRVPAGSDDSFDYVDNKVRTDVWICLLPMLPIHIWRLR